MRRLTLLGLFFSSLAVQAQGPVPPVAKPIPYTYQLHGDTRYDNYVWLKDKTNPETIKYLTAENDYMKAMTASLVPFEKKLYDGMLSHIKQTDLDVPVFNHGYWYYSRTVEGQQYAIHCRKKGTLEAAEEIMLDANALAKGEKFMSVGGISVSDDNRLLCYTTDTTGFREYYLNVKDLTTGAMIETKSIKITASEWATDNKTILYITEDAAKRSHKLWRHVIGDDKEKDTLVYEEKDALYVLGLSRTRDRKYFLRTSESATTAEIAFLTCDTLSGEWKVIAPRQEGHLYSVDHGNGLFQILSNGDGATNFKWMTCPVTETDRTAWKEFMPYNPAIYLQRIDAFKNFAVVSERQDGLPHVRIYRYASREQLRIPVPEPVYEIGMNNNPDFETQSVRYSYTSLVTPASVFEFDLKNKESKLLKQTEVPGYNAKEYASERIEATAPDGMKVPISLVYKKGFEKNGKAAALLYAYGSYGATLPVHFDSSRLELLDRGVVYAQAHIRGGSDLGREWYLNGKLMKKINTFTDFIACADHLVNAKYCDRNRLAIEGRSAGGLLMGAVVNLRPDLCKVAHYGVPFVDVINTMLDESLPLTIQEFLEWGNPKDKAAYDYMKTYCPYSNLRICDYPSILVTTSLNDSQVLFHEPAKLVAKLRTMKTDKNPLILKCNMDAGHGGASGRYDHLKEKAFEYAFMLNELGITK